MTNRKEIRLLELSRVERIEIVDEHDAMSFVEHALGEMTTYEPAPPVKRTVKGCAPHDQ
jgi:hypothetical protein